MTKKADLVSHSARLARTKKPAVLVVAEDAEVRRHLADALDFDGSVAVEPVDGAEAIALGKRIAKFDVVVSELELDDGKKELVTQGDCVVQRGTKHAWRVVGDEPLVLCASMIGAQRG